MLENFRNASPGRQIAAVAGAAFLLAAVIALAWYFLLRTVYQPIFSGLQPADAATIVAELEKRKIPYRLAEHGEAILVPTERAEATRLDIMSTDLPLKGTVGLELFNTSDMGMTDFAQKINYQRALQGELARTVMAMDGVEAVRVHLALGQDRVFRDDRVPPKASIILRMANDAPVTEAGAQGIQRLVAAAVDQLEPNNVVVLDEAGNVVSNVAPSLADTHMQSPVVQEKLAIEQYYAARIRRALSSVYPNGSIAVSVWAGPVNASIRSEAGENSVAWNAGDRNFRLNVTLSPDLNLSEDARQEVHDIVANAIDFEPSLGDAIDFGPLSTPLSQAGSPVAPKAARRVDGPAPPEQDEAGSGIGWPVGILLVLAGLLAGALLRGIRRRTNARRLNENERMAFADRLAALLHEEGRDNAAA